MFQKWHYKVDLENRYLRNNNIMIPRNRFNESKIFYFSDVSDENKQR